MKESVINLRKLTRNLDLFKRETVQMKWMNKLERKFGKYAIPNLMYYIIILYALGFIFNMIAPGFYYNYLSVCKFSQTS